MHEVGRKSFYIKHGVAVLAGLAVPHLVCVLVWGTAIFDMASGLGVSPAAYVLNLCTSLLH